MSHAPNNSESFRKKISPERNFAIVIQENISDEYGKATVVSNPTGGSKDVEQIPLILAVKGPISLRREAWNADRSAIEPYRVTVGATGVV